MSVFGGFLSNLVDSASSAAKSAAASIANGASYVGGKIADGASYVGEKVTEGAKWAADTATEGARRALRAGVGGAANVLGHGTNAINDAAQGVKAAYNKVRSVFTDKPPEQPCIDCANKDTDFDGVLVGYKDGKCVPLTQKGKPVTPDDIKAAKQAGYNPASNSAYNDDKPGEKALNTSQATKDCCAKCTAGKPPRTIFYTNGINTNHKTHCETLKQIGDSTCATVIGVYNATQNMAMDLYQTTQERALKQQANLGRKTLAHDGRNPAVDTLSDVIVMETRAGNPPELFAHSQGGAITSLALHDASNTLKAGPPDTPHSLNGMKVTSFGSAAPNWVEGPDYTHYVNVNDLTPMYFGLGDNPSTAAKGGPTAKFVAFSGSPNTPGPFATGDKMDKHVFPGLTKYHGIDDEMYLKMYEQEQKRIAEEKRKLDPKADAGCQCGHR